MSEAFDSAGTGRIVVAGLIVAVAAVLGTGWLLRPPSDATSRDAIRYDPATSDIESVLNRTARVDWQPPADVQRFDRILLVTLDTTRADHLSVYGYPRPTSPFLEELASEGVVFERAFAPASQTVPSHASLMTSRYPLQHGIQRNGQELPEDLTTLAEVLATSGYRTAAFVSTDRHFVASGLDRGFDVVDEPEREEFLVADEGTSERRSVFYRPADRTLSRALRWAESQVPTRRVFVWVHLFDSHLPYVSRTDYRERVRPSDPAERSEWLEFLRRTHGIDPLGSGHWYGSSRVQTANALELYDSEVLYRDEQLGAFVRELEGAFQERFLIVVTADHGEGLGSHDHWRHAKIYNEQIRVPLVMRFPDGRWRGQREDRIVELTDLFPTLAWAGGVAPELLPESLEGQPLQWLLAGEGLTSRHGAAFAQRRSYRPPTILARARDLGARMLGRPRHFELGERYALVRGDWKYFYVSSDVDELYDLSADPWETESRIGASESETGLASTLFDLVRFLRATSPGSASEVDPETLRALRSLGYIQ